MNPVTFEIIQQGAEGIEEIYDFWMKEWNLILKKLANTEATPNMFREQSFFYVIRNHGKIAGIMSSAWQSSRDNLSKNEYYGAYPEGPAHLKSIGIYTFHKMGMIAVDVEQLPKGIRMVPTIIGCGIRFTNQLAECEGVVSFPRSDTSVYKSCVEWGFRTVKDSIVMYNVPVNFVLLIPKEMKEHCHPAVVKAVDFLWESRIERLVKNRVAA